MPRELSFLCESCELTFASEPDGTGYEQARCPQCGYLCMTVDFVKQEREERKRSEALLATIIDFLLKLFGLGIFKQPRDSAKKSWWTRQNGSEIESKPDEADRLVTVAQFSHDLDAHCLCEVLEEHDIDATILTDLAKPGKAEARVVEVQVRARDIEVAAAVYEGYLAECAEPDPAQVYGKHAGMIEFTCIECSEFVAFPAHRGGGVEVCPRCGCFLDVPDL